MKSIIVGAIIGAITAASVVVAGRIAFPYIDRRLKQQRLIAD